MLTIKSENRTGGLKKINVLTENGYNQSKGNSITSELNLIKIDLLLKMIKAREKCSVHTRLKITPVFRPPKTAL